MKIPEKSKEKKEKIKRKEKIKPKKEQVLIVAQEFKFARLLSGNEKKTRDRVLKSLKKWILHCFEKGYEFKEDDFTRVWKGLFYAVWMSDKPLIQEELCENISAVLDLFPEEHLRHALLMYKAGLRVLASEWYGLDQHRTDKFLMLVRRYVRASLRCLLRCKWSPQSCKLYANTLSANDGIFALKTPHYARNSLSMLLHIVDCYLEEIAKVSAGEIPGPSLLELVRPLCAYMCYGAAPALCAAARRMLTALLRQSDQGLRYQLATAAWQKMGCPEGGPEALELVSDDEDDELQNGDDNSDDEDLSEKPLDPRAGRVNVELPSLPVPAAQLARMLTDFLPSAPVGKHKMLRICIQRFDKLSKDEYPLPVQPPSADTPAPEVKPQKSAQALHALEKTLVANSDELALRGLSRKHRKRLLAKSRSGASIVEEVDTVRQKLCTQVTNNGWKVEPAEPEAKKPKQNTTQEKRNKKRKIDVKVNGDTHKRQKRNSDVVATTNLDNKVDKVKDKPILKAKVTENGGKTDKNDKIGKSNGKIDKNNVKVDKNNAKVDKTQKNNEKVILNGKTKKQNSPVTKKDAKNTKNPTLLVNKVKQFQKHTKNVDKNPENNFDTPKKVKFALKNNSMQQPVDYYKSVRQSPNIPFDSTKKPIKTNLKPSTPSPINPFFKKKLRLKN